MKGYAPQTPHPGGHLAVALSNSSVYDKYMEHIYCDMCATQLEPLTAVFWPLVTEEGQLDTTQLCPECTTQLYLHLPTT